MKLVQSPRKSRSIASNIGIRIRDFTRDRDCDESRDRDSDRDENRDRDHNQIRDQYRFLKIFAFEISFLAIIHIHFK